MSQTEEKLREELEKVKKDFSDLQRKSAEKGLTFKLGKDKKGSLSAKISQNGGLSVYGLGRWPVTLYKEQWLRLLDVAEDIRMFIHNNQVSLKDKAVKEKVPKADPAKADPAKADKPK